MPKNFVQIIQIKTPRSYCSIFIPVFRNIAYQLVVQRVVA